MVSTGSTAPPNPTPTPPAPQPSATPFADVDTVGRADALVARHAFAEALLALGDDDEPAAALVRARAVRGLGDTLAAERTLAGATIDPEIAAAVAIERGLLALGRGDVAFAATTLLPLVKDRDPLLTPAIDALAQALAASDPLLFLANYDDFERLRRRDDPDARSRLLGEKADVLRHLGKVDDARAVDKQRYLEEPVSLLTPDQVPEGTTLSNAEVLARIEILQEANRNERVVKALDAIADDDLLPAQRCQKRLALGLAARKLRDYGRAETELANAVTTCKGDDERTRRAMYLHAKVVSIRDGLRSIPLIDAFVKRYPDHSMADDVLFWAGDIFQRRGRLDQARAYYRRIDELKGKDDYCLEARWRLAWMSYRAGDFKSAKKGLETMLAGGCSMVNSDRARGHYWLGRIAQSHSDKATAAAEYRTAFEEDAMGFYAQLAVTRLSDIDPDVFKGLASTALPSPAANEPAEACVAAQANEPGFKRAETFLARGLKTDARQVLLAIAPPAAEVISSTHAAALGVVAKYVQHNGVDNRCAREVRLHLALLLDRAGAYKDAHWRLRTEFSAELSVLPTAATAGLWRAAYPLAWRDEIALAEHESHVPNLLLQALSREESAFDPQVVSWAGAYGLTQLLLSTGRDAGKLLKPKVTVTRAEDLLDPTLNARLGGAFLASLIKRYDGNTALALAAYNAGTDAATAWWKRVGQDGLDVLGEEISIQETRGYVKRVLRTYGIYRWLYDGELPALPLSIAAGKPTPD